MGSDPFIQSPNRPAVFRIFRRFPFQNPRPIPVTPDMPDPPRLPVVPFRKCLLQPLHDSGEFKPVPGLDVKRKPVILKTQMADLEDKPMFRLMKYPVENRPDFRPLEQWFPIVNLGADFVPDTLLEFS
jgi:hypothetical protein